MMKISLWQQFSSNHSASFTVVGVFASEQSAIQAQQELNHVLAEIADSYWSLPATDARRMRENQQIMLPTEYHIAKRYQIDWPRSARWIVAHDPGDLTLSRADNMLYLHSFNHAFQGPQPFDALIKALDGEVAIYANGCDDYENVYLALNLTCETTNPEQAEWIDLVFQDYRDSSATNHELYGIIEKFVDDLPDHVTYNLTERADSRLSFKRLCLDDITELPRFIKYLERQGCRDIQFEFVEVR
jgi:hypothetical protein